MARTKEGKETPVVVGAAGQGIWDMVQGLLLEGPRGDLLDAAAGGGQLASRLEACGYKAVGLDIQNQWQHPEIEFLQHDLDLGLPFEDSSFDAVILVEAIGYLENPAFTLREFHRVLRPGGMVVISMPNIFSLQSRIRFLLNATYRWFPHVQTSETSKSGLADTYREPLRLTTLQFLMGRAGLEVTRIAFGGGKALTFLAPAAWLIQGISTLHNATRKAGRKRTPPLVNSSKALFFTNVALAARKGTDPALPPSKP